MLLLVGLGNPGERYAGNRHNIGFLAVEAIARRHGFSPWRRRFHSEVAEGELGGRRTLAVKPQTYMNESGRAVGEALRYLRLEAGDVLVLHDELDLAPGRLRIKRGGGHAGHNGLRSLTQHIGPEFRRLRLGIGHPGDKTLVQHYVLSDFAKADSQWLKPLLEAVAEEAPLLASGAEKDEAAFLSKVSQKLQPAKAPSRTEAQAPNDQAPNEQPGQPGQPPEAKPAATGAGEGALARALRRAAARLTRGDKDKES